MVARLPLVRHDCIAFFDFGSNWRAIDSKGFVAPDYRRVSIKLTGLAVRYAHMQREALCLTRIHRDCDFSVPWVVGLLHHLDIGASYFLDVDTAADEKVHIDSIAVFYISPRWDHQQGARDVAHAARADMP